MTAVISQKKKLRIELLKDGLSLGSFLSEKNSPVVIGSSRNADIILPGASVAKIHALVRPSSEQNVCVFDLGSRSGTYVGSRRIIEDTIPHGSSFTIGSCDLKVCFEDWGKEESLFWSPPNGSEILHAFYLINENVFESSHLVGKGKLRITTALGPIFAERNQDSTTVLIPREMRAELYTKDNTLLQTLEAREFQVSSNQKLRILWENFQIQICWSAQDARIERKEGEQDQQLKQNSLLISSILFLVLGAGLWMLSPRKIPVSEETFLPKTDYMRVTMDSAPRGEAAPSATDSHSAAPSEQASATKADSSTSAQKAVSSVLNKLLAKADKPLKVGSAGIQTVRVASTSNSFSQQAIGGGVGSGTIDSKSISAGLKSGGGSGGIKGFGQSMTGSTGLGEGLGKGNSNGFGLNLGSDEAEAVGGLDKSLIAAVVQANIGQIKHCYERQLLVDSSLAGKVVAGWVINGTGAVDSTSVKKTSLNSAPVEDCIQKKIKSWKFPQPKGGGKVIVSYPFLFRALN